MQAWCPLELRQAQLDSASLHLAVWLRHIVRYKKELVHASMTRSFLQQTAWLCLNAKRNPPMGFLAVIAFWVSYAILSLSADSFFCITFAFSERGKATIRKATNFLLFYHILSFFATCLASSMHFFINKSRIFSEFFCSRMHSSRLHLSSQEAGCAAGQCLFGISHADTGIFVQEDHCPDGITFTQDGTDGFGRGEFILFCCHGDAVLPILAHQKLIPVLNEIFQLTADGFPGIFFPVVSCCCHHLIPVSDADAVAAGHRQGFRILFGKSAEFSDRGVFFQDDLALAVREDLKRISFFDPQGAADFFGDDDTAEVI